jgi:hypothetical protein
LDNDPSSQNLADDRVHTPPLASPLEQHVYDPHGTPPIPELVRSAPSTGLTEPPLLMPDTIAGRAAVPGEAGPHNAFFGGLATVEEDEHGQVERGQELVEGMQHLSMDLNRHGGDGEKDDAAGV